MASGNWEPAIGDEVCRPRAGGDPADGAYTAGSLDARLRGHDVDVLPRSVIVGSAVISHCSEPTGDPASDFPDCWQWHLTDVRRYKRPRNLPGGVQPQPVWFRPYPKAA